MFYDFAPIKEKQGALTNIGYPGYPANTLQRWTVVPPIGLECKVRVLLVDLTSNSDELCANADHVRSASTFANSPQPLDFNALEWKRWPCKLATPLEEPIPKGHMMVIEFITDSDADNDGKGFRLSWECADYKTPQL